MGILAAIAIPRFTNVTNKSKWSAHAANIKTIESAVEMALANGVKIADIDVAVDAADGSHFLKDYLPEWPKKPGTYVLENGVLTATPSKANTLLEVEKTTGFTTCGE